MKDKKLSAARAAGMAGEQNLQRLAAYLSRISGQLVAPNQEVTLRSIERAALSSWLRREDISVRQDCLRSGASFTITQLLSAEAPTPSPQSALSPKAGNEISTAAPGRVGVDIEEIESLPAADDYREHAFYQDHFTSSEISYCICQADVRASFCGIWAAKEAIIKAGVVDTTIDRLNAIELAHDVVGRPTFRNCSISISHTPRAAVAVCLVHA